MGTWLKKILLRECIGGVYPLIKALTFNGKIQNTYKSIARSVILLCVNKRHISLFLQSKYFGFWQCVHFHDEFFAMKYAPEKINESIAEDHIQ
jgi:hypothetical protein